MIPLDGLLNISSGFGENCSFLFLAIFLIVPFHLVFVVASKIKLFSHFSFYCSRFEWPEIWHADIPWPPSELIRFRWSSAFDFAISVAFWLSETGHICDFRAFSRERKSEWLEIWYVNVFWPPSEFKRLLSQSVDFPYFGTILTDWNKSNLGFPGFSLEGMGGMA